MDATLRPARPADAAAIRRIYAPYVEETAVSFATAPPSVEDLETKVEKTRSQYPWLVAERESEREDGVVGYAYAGALRERDAYQWTAELSVYVAETAQREGLGRRLYEALLAFLERQGYASAYGVVTLPNPASVALHESLGFERVGLFDDVGYKHGAWHDVGWWRRRLPEPAAPDPPVPFSALPDEDVADALVRYSG
ncbi:GNAT family N-acetyltransferase [Salinigranum rubrum]|uniref:GNAT family N-acetyltransferase n=1 Tax=Salinigranum rubrum TaxID=755307 RepID=A0A2I8VIB2_9EURY|nr:arsinothricin resistance N-acetyltransferase ArsN1 family B [Salinigranum rubrum]AUV81668.1 GNAT family N-acetyltransferase [Salinigranum rubrum]